MMHEAYVIIRYTCAYIYIFVGSYMYLQRVCKIYEYHIIRTHYVVLKLATESVRVPKHDYMSYLLLLFGNCVTSFKYFLILPPVVAIATYVSDWTHTYIYIFYTYVVYSYYASSTRHNYNNNRIAHAVCARQ